MQTNALLRGEQRNTETTAYHLNHLNQRIVKMPRVANPSLTICYESIPNSLSSNFNPLLVWTAT
ncbi:hypothetical protein B4U81_25185 [Vibrio campbellii]|nr:hypothetical protein B4U81_25185 [Vibrio campbellii]